jgi:hypothetical protein
LETVISAATTISVKHILAADALKPTRGTDGGTSYPESENLLPERGHPIRPRIADSHQLPCDEAHDPTPVPVDEALPPESTS